MEELDTKLIVFAITALVISLSLYGISVDPLMKYFVIGVMVFVSLIALNIATDHRRM